VDAISSLGAFILLAHDLASSPNLRPSTLGDNSSVLISKTLRLLMSAFGVGDPDETIKLGEDEALFWSWWCVQGAVKEGEELDESLFFALVEVSVSFSLSAPRGQADSPRLRSFSRPSHPSPRIPPPASLPSGYSLRSFYAEPRRRKSSS
jgi:hypothetical protein